MTSASRIAADCSTTACDQLVGRSHAIMRGLRSWFKHKPSVELAHILGCDVRSAERYFAGDRTPDGNSVFAMLRHPVGVAMVEAATRDLPLREYRNFWNEMAKATLRAHLRDESVNR